MQRVRRSLEIVRIFGVKEFYLRIYTYVHPPKPLSIADAAKAGMSIARDSLGVASILGGDPRHEPLNESKHEALVKEWEVLAASIDLNASMEFPREYDVETQTARTLYILTRWLRPKVILETGIARGLSSFALLAAAETNQEGTVYSCDVDPRSGHLVTETLKHRWKRRIINAKDAEHSFREFLEEVGEVDFFFHDSNHREAWMIFEFAEVLKQISPGGILGSDDVDLNRAFLDVVPHASAVAVLLDSRKASAFAVVDGHDVRSRDEISNPPP